jgi:hypothetical protein
MLFVLVDQWPPSTRSTGQNRINLGYKREIYLIIHNLITKSVQIIVVPGLVERSPEADGDLGCEIVSENNKIYPKMVFSRLCSKIQTLRLTI